MRPKAAICGLALIGLALAVGAEGWVQWKARWARQNAVQNAPQNKEPQRYGELPLYFIENRGQLDRHVAYYLAGSDKSLFFTRQGVLIAMQRRAERQAAASVTESVTGHCLDLGRKSRTRYSSAHV